MLILNILDDLNQPYSCSEWGGDFGEEDIPPIIHNADKIFTRWFEKPDATSFSYPFTIFIDGNMEVFKIIDSVICDPAVDGPDCAFNEVNDTIEQMLLEL